MAALEDTPAAAQAAAPEAAPEAATATISISTSPAHAEWMEKHWAPSQRKRNPGLAFTLNLKEGGLTIAVAAEGSPIGAAAAAAAAAGDAVDEAAAAVDAVTLDADSTSSPLVKWQKQVEKDLKKIQVENLGDMGGRKRSLLASFTEDGLEKLAEQENEHSVAVVFQENGIILLVGTKSKLAKKCVQLKTLLSHYHWRLSGRDVAFEG